MVVEQYIKSSDDDQTPKIFKQLEVESFHVSPQTPIMLSLGTQLAPECQVVFLSLCQSTALSSPTHSP